jgi:hypothetical protein
VIALKPACGRRDALEVVMFNPRKEDRRLSKGRAWVWLWRAALVACAALAWVLVNR